VVEVRLQVKPTRFRIPDVMVLHPGQKKTQIVRQAPLLCIEVLSPEDTFKRLKEKVDEYLAMGVQHIWVFAPPSREAYVCDAAGFHKILTPDISIPNTAIRLTLTEVFSVLDSE
jgi:Uma2 family endonuclease